MIATQTLAGYQGTGSFTFNVRLGSGMHQLVGSATSTNAVGSSTVTTPPVTVTVEDAISTIDTLSFSLAGAAGVRYFGQLAFVVRSARRKIGEGVLGASAQTFNSLPVPVPVKSRETLCLRERLDVDFGQTSTVNVSTSAMVNGYSHTESQTINVRRWGRRSAAGEFLVACH